MLNLIFTEIISPDFLKEYINIIIEGEFQGFHQLIVGQNQVAGPKRESVFSLVIFLNTMYLSLARSLTD